MAKWADYGISCVTNSTDGKRIASVGAYEDKGDSLGVKRTFTRAQVVEALGKGTTFVTIYKNANGQWEKGAAVKRYAVAGEWFIKTVDNGKVCDNLDELPSC